MDKLAAAEKALERGRNVEFTMGTSGWDDIMSEIRKEIEWAFNKSVSPEFRKAVIEKPETYFEHYGYINGLKKVEDITKKIILAKELAEKDLDKWESQKNRRGFMGRMVKK